VQAVLIQAVVGLTQWCVQQTRAKIGDAMGQHWPEMADNANGS
jgi:hypothetical protein